MYSDFHTDTWPSVTVQPVTMVLLLLKPAFTTVWVAIPAATPSCSNDGLGTRFTGARSKEEGGEERMRGVWRRENGVEAETHECIEETACEWA